MKEKKKDFFKKAGAKSQNKHPVYNALDVARYIVYYSDQAGYLVSNLKLQKLLYFVQAYYLTFEKKPRVCFSENILAWSFGPVVLPVYQEFKQFGAGTIPVRYAMNYVELDDNLEFHTKTYKPEIIEPEDQVTINAVVDFFADYSATAMLEIIFGQQPWKKAYNPLLEDEKAGIISQQEIKKYFSFGNLSPFFY